jgi:hypothetical protein
MLKMPAPVSPKQLKRIVEIRGYELVGEDEWNWALAKDKGVPIIVPKDGEYVSIETMEEVLASVGLNTPGDYFPLRDQSAKELGLQPN